jgi:predicted enzyme related to lactoylglutathione lyase
MPTTTVMNYIELPATDLAATKTFYAAAFGWDWIDYGPGYASHGADGLEVALNGDGTVAPPHGAGEQNGIGPFVLFSTEDLAGSVDDIVAAGGVLLTEPYDYPGGRRVHFVDPSGNVLGVYQPAGPED